MEEVGNFVKREKLILYGGYALNMILPQNEKIYRYHTPSIMIVIHIIQKNMQ